MDAHPHSELQRVSTRRRALGQGGSDRVLLEGKRLEDRDFTPLRIQAQVVDRARPAHAPIHSESTTFTWVLLGKFRLGKFRFWGIGN